MERGTFKLSPASEKILSTVRPDLQKVIRRAAELTTTPFAVVSGNRTQAQQDYLYAQGRTRPGMVVTWTRNSNHMGGGAIDFSAVDEKGNPTNHLKHTWNAGYYKPIADTILFAGKELGIPVSWPLWQKGDWGHLELQKPYRPLTSTEKLKADQGPYTLTTPDVVATKEQSGNIGGVDGKVPVLQPGGGDQGSRNTVVVPDKSKETKEMRQETPGMAGPGVQGVQRSSGKPNVPHNEGKDGLPFAKTRTEGRVGAQATLPAASYRPPEAGEHSANLSRPEAAVAFLEGMGWEKHQAAAIVANGVWESGGKDRLATLALGDKDKDGRFTAHGAFQWRGDRYSGPNGLLSFTLTHCPGHSSSEPWVQLRFAHHELTEGQEKKAGRLIKEAKTLEDAVKGAISFLRPVHFTWEAPEKGHGFQRRLEIAQWIMGQRSSPK
jgi:peptidoglycan L-alanyl-D-glutamate endopeptidase CwlK